MKSDKAAYKQARANWEEIRTLHQRFLDAVKRADEASQRLCEAAIVASVPPGLYEHWKSKDGNSKLYVVEGTGIEQDTFRPVVSYFALYEPHHGQLTFRHLTNRKNGFLAPIHRKSAPYLGPRFAFLRRLTITDRAVLKERSADIAKCGSRDSTLARIRALVSSV